MINATKLIMNVPDHQQPWVLETSVTEKNLCTPTAFASQFRTLFDLGRILEIPTGTPYVPGMPYNQRGWMDFAYDGSSISNPTLWSAVSANVNPSFSWWFNTNNNGAQDVANTVGTSTISAIDGAKQIYSRTTLSNKWGAFVKNDQSARGILPHARPFSVAFSMQQTLDVLKISVDADLPVVIFLDSYSISPHQVHSGDNVSTYYINSYAASANHLEESYVNSDNSLESVGHTVVMVGHSQFNGCEWIIVQDNDHTTGKYVALPFDSACGGTRSAWDSFLGAFFLDPPQNQSSGSPPPPPPLLPPQSVPLSSLPLPPPPRSPPSSPPPPFSPPPFSPESSPSFLSCSDVRNVYYDNQCCAESNASTCLRVISPCTDVSHGYVCVDSSNQVVVKGLREMMENLQAAFEFTNSQILFKKHLIPNENDEYDIGEAERKVRDFYLSDS